MEHRRPSFCPQQLRVGCAEVRGRLGGGQFLMRGLLRFPRWRKRENSSERDLYNLSLVPGRRPGLLHWRGLRATDRVFYQRAVKELQGAELYFWHR